MPPLLYNWLQTVVVDLAQTLDEMEIDYAIMGGAATCLITTDSGRTTEDVDLVIHVDQRMITADRLTTELLTRYSSKFVPINQFGHTIPAYNLALPEGYCAVCLEVFDYLSWPQRPQYNVKSATRRFLNINGYHVKLFGAEWILREKILSQHGRQGSVKEKSDIQDIINLLPLVIPGTPELDFNNNEESRTALSNLLQKQPELTPDLKEKILCTDVFGTSE